jgi:phosphate transport system permease protein
MAAVIANEFTEAADALYLNALVEIGLVLFLITIGINALSRLLIWRVSRVKSVTVAQSQAEVAVAA